MISNPQALLIAAASTYPGIEDAVQVGLRLHVIPIPSSFYRILPVELLQVLRNLVLVHSPQSCR